MTDEREALFELIEKRADTDFVRELLAFAAEARRLARTLPMHLRQRGGAETIVGPLGYGLVIVVIAYLSVIDGELVPKSLALRNAEGIACSVAPAMTLFSKIAALWRDSLGENGASIRMRRGSRARR